MLLCPSGVPPDVQQLLCITTVTVHTLIQHPMKDHKLSARLLTHHVITALPGMCSVRETPTMHHYTLQGAFPEEGRKREKDVGRHE